MIPDGVEADLIGGIDVSLYEVARLAYEMRLALFGMTEQRDLVDTLLF